MSGQDEIRLGTAKFDARFPNTNQTRNCWTNFRDYHKCLKIRGEGDDACIWFKRNYKCLCPVSWVSCLLISPPYSVYTQLLFPAQVEQWEEQVENGTFPGKL